MQWAQWNYNIELWNGYIYRHGYQCRDIMIPPPLYVLIQTTEVQTRYDPFSFSVYSQL